MLECGDDKLSANELANPQTAEVIEACNGIARLKVVLRRHRGDDPPAPRRQSEAAIREVWSSDLWEEDD